MLIFTTPVRLYYSNKERKEKKEKKNSRTLLEPNAVVCNMYDDRNLRQGLIQLSLTLTLAESYSIVCTRTLCQSCRRYFKLLLVCLLVKHTVLHKFEPSTTRYRYIKRGWVCYFVFYLLFSFRVMTLFGIAGTYCISIS